MEIETKHGDLAMEIHDLFYCWDGALLPALKNISLQLSSGSRLLLVGMNASGKSTLLDLMAGRHVARGGTVKIFGKDAFHDTSLNKIRSYITSEWSVRSIPFSTSEAPLTADIAVHEMMKDLQVRNMTKTLFHITISFTIDLWLSPILNIHPYNPGKIRLQRMHFLNGGMS